MRMLPIGWTVRLAVAAVASCFLVTAPALAMETRNDPGCSDASIRYIRPDREAGRSMATVVGDVPLAHTGQFMALGENGQIVGADNPRQQTARVLENIDLALSRVESSLDDVLKLNVYVTHNDVAEAVRAEFAETFTGEAKPAVSFVVSRLPHPGALVAIDAVAVACGADGNSGPTIYRAEELGGSPAQGHVAVLPPGGKMYVSGQVAPGDLMVATAGTMESLFATLAYFGLSADDVVQVKAFMPDVSKAPEVEEVIGTYFREDPAPPFVPVEWKDASYLPYLSTEGEDATPIEIELIASRNEEREVQASDPASYLTPPSLSAPRTYSRAVEYHRGDIVYVSGLYGDPTRDAEGQVREIYNILEEVLTEAGTGLDSLLKGTYYVTGSEANDRLDAIREELYDPTRAPASAKMPVDAVGKEGALITLDMIGVVP